MSDDSAVEAAKKILNGHPSGMGYPIGEMCRDAETLARALLASQSQVERMREAALDALSGWRYIRMMHGDLPGVGWDRVENALSAALTSKEE